MQQVFLKNGQVVVEVDEALQDYLRVTVIAGGFAHISSGCIAGPGEFHLAPDHIRYQLAAQ
ncbi:MAG: hypothetical protein D9V47_12455 [Clostridia bacterium]|nr:MAG: hypothetical protein D9V47_12455 [Clostridia bacterium]